MLKFVLMVNKQVGLCPALLPALAQLRDPRFCAPGGTWIHERASRRIRTTPGAAGTTTGADEAELIL